MKLFSKLLILLVISSYVFIGCGHPTSTDLTPVKPRSMKTKLSDALIHNKVTTRLSKNKFVDARYIVVDVYNSFVTLTGTVKTDSMRISAGHTARSILNVIAVKNHIKVQY